MERCFKEITTLAEDLEFHLGNWELNPHVTGAQRRLWPGAKLPQTALGTDDQNSLRLLKEDGHDGEPVGSLGKASAGKFFCSEGRLFPPERDLVRFGYFAISDSSVLSTWW